MMQNNTNLTTNDSASFDDFTWSFRTITILIVCSLITILTILGNGLVLISIKFRLRAPSYSDYFIVSLCLADFFVGLFVMPLMTIHSLYLRWPFHYRLCYVWMSIDFTCSTASFLTLASMALDRYWALTAPYFHLRNRSYSSVLIFIISSWAIPFAIWPGSIFISHHYSTIDPSCVHPAHPVIIVGLCTFFYYIPLLFMLVCYSRIIVNIKNIEVLIKDTFGSIKSNSSNGGFDSSSRTKIEQIDGYTRNDLISLTRATTTSSLSSIRSLFYKYIQRNRLTNSIKISANEKQFIMNRKNSNEYGHSINSKRRSTVVGQGEVQNLLLPKSSLSPQHRLCQPPRAIFKRKKRSFNDTLEDKRFKDDSIAKQDNEQQQLVCTGIKTHRLSLPAIRYDSCHYYRNSLPANTIKTKVTIEDQPRDIANDHQNSVTSDRSQSQSPTLVECNGNGNVKTVPLSKPISSVDNNNSNNNKDDENRRVNHRNQPIRLSNPCNSSRYSQHAVAQFMHERRKACLRRNQKASRMLGILLAVFLICWLPFTIFYPTSIFYPNKLSNELESITFWFGYANSLLNPFLYVYSSRNFRQAIIETLCCHVRLRARQRQRLHYQCRSAPIIIDNKFLIFNSKPTEQNNSSVKKFSSLLNVKSTGAFHDHTNAKNNQQELDAMNKIVDQTDHDLRRALKYANLRHEQLDELEFRSEEMLSKNENLVFVKQNKQQYQNHNHTVEKKVDGALIMIKSKFPGITNYRKTQERDLLWRRLRYIALGAITIGIIILLIILSMTTRRPAPSSQVINVRHFNDGISNKNSNKDVTSTMKLITSYRRRKK
ncbi:unnamed protein product [Rotaria socialis]|uniref:G-protein coupled receptors family 1 profile domain-containing protein n=1 Tax=Rotaria socialis TaxID=392032 RepID=A0A817Z3U7_9BILA|nr:unnamed protein product [Rotaria socialis]